MNIEDGGKKVGIKEGRKAEKLGFFSVKEGRKQGYIYICLTPCMYIFQVTKTLMLQKTKITNTVHVTFFFSFPFWTNFDPQ